MASSSNNLSGDHCHLTFKEKLALFEKTDGNKATEAKPKVLSITNIFPNCDNKENKAINIEGQNASVISVVMENKEPSKKDSTSTDNNVWTSSAPNTSSSHRTTPSTTSSSGGLRPLVSQSSAEVLRPSIPSQQSTSKKSTARLQFRKSAEAILNDTSKTFPEILEVFTDLEKFIENELTEISAKKRMAKKALEGIEKVNVFTKLKEEYYKDKQQHQKEFEKQLDQPRKSETVFSAIEELDENDDSSILNAADVSQMNRKRDNKIKKLKAESVKHEYLLGKINRVLEQITRIDERNLQSVVNIERHYLVASSRFQSTLTEIKRLENPNEELHPRPFDRKGKVIISEIMLEVKPNYFKRRNDIHNEYVVVVLKYEDLVYASKAICIHDDIRTIRFPQTFQINEAYLDFEIRLEVYGTTFWRQRNMIRSTMLKKYGFSSFTLAQTGQKRQRLDLTEVIKSDNNPLRSKVLLNVRQKITVDVQFSGVLLVKIADLWFKTYAMLVGHLLEISLADDDKSNVSDNMLLDLYNFDSEFAVPVIRRIAQRSYAFLLKFNHHVDENDFHLLVAAEDMQSYAGWMNSINKALVLIK